ncbi:M48 family metallopeptidase [Actinokineospora cianjurensis]|uniref:Zn-dependent protease with chaperone function n=1 Tax=Actinokineospora cianjurensis TaxID=585224 RepID=A0A421B3L8_9PSEU|nr:M48 family metallopeptidase [Actinokineospora cianjurensis]RLK58971.1 Zn-dependent protease with chaperone function [Actinokineospora cianjurensis]
MFVGLRAALAVAMLAGFYLLALGVAGGLVVLEVVALRESPVLGLKLAFFVVPAVFAILVALVSIERRRDDIVDGVAITPSQQPRLWALVTELASRVGTRPPDEIRVVAAVNAAVVENTRLLGLVVTSRRLYVGAPLLAGLSEQQMASVLAHELGHYANRDTRLSGVVVTGRDALRRVVTGMSGASDLQGALAGVFASYAKVYMRLSSAICRRQELAADAVSARIAGSAAAASALRELHVVDFSWTWFLKRHITTGWAVGYLPRSIFDRFTELRATPELAPVLADLRAQDPPGGDADPYDSHPPTLSRVAAIEAIAAPTPADWPDRPALALVDDPVPLLDRALLLAMNGVDERKRVDWTNYGHLVIQQHMIAATRPLAQAAGRVRGGQPTLRAVLDALDAGKLLYLAPVDEDEQTGGPRARRERARTSVGDALGLLVNLALVAAGHGRWDVDWTGNATLRLTDTGLNDLPDLLAAALADDRDSTDLRAVLVRAGVDLDFQPIPALINA